MIQDSEGTGNRTQNLFVSCDHSIRMTYDNPMNTKHDLSRLTNQSDRLSTENSEGQTTRQLKLNRPHNLHKLQNHKQIYFLISILQKADRNKQTRNRSSCKTAHKLN